jgi:Cysteine rich repeat
VPGALGVAEAPEAAKGLSQLRQGNRLMKTVLSKPWRAPALAAAGCLLLGLGLAAGSPATPAAAQGTPAQRAACEQDAQRLCSQFLPDENSTASCLRRHRMSLSPDCRAAFSGKASRRARASARQR